MVGKHCKSLKCVGVCVWFTIVNIRLAHFTYSIMMESLYIWMPLRKCSLIVQNWTAQLYNKYYGK